MLQPAEFSQRRWNGSDMDQRGRGMDRREQEFGEGPHVQLCPSPGGDAARHEGREYRLACQRCDLRPSAHSVAVGGSLRRERVASANKREKATGHGQDLI
jgi:hypothetical protein